MKKRSLEELDVRNWSEEFSNQEQKRANRPLVVRRNLRRTTTAHASFPDLIHRNALKEAVFMAADMARKRIR